MDNIHKFDEMADVYSKYRPSYPCELTSKLIIEKYDEINTICDLGSGTGILTKQIIVTGKEVFAVEPNFGMREKVEDRLNSYPNFHSINGSSSDTTLKDDSIDIITVAQAFHWFDIPEFMVEANRILKTDGKLAIIYNKGVRSEDLIGEISLISAAFCPNYKGGSGGTEKNDNLFTKVYENYEEFVFPNPLYLNINEFLGFNLSSSYALKPGDTNYEKYISLLIRLFIKYAENGVITMPMETTCKIGEIQRVRK